MKLSCANISKSFGAQQVLTGCDFSVTAGQCAVIKGVSGGGKSTLLRILALIDRADTGTVAHDEIVYESASVGINSLGAELPFPFLTLVFQQLYLWPHLTIAGNIAISLTGRPSALLTDEALSLLDRLEVGKLVGKKPHECSMGERQRVAIARAILTPARFLLLDEPTSALDGASSRIVVAALRDCMTSQRGLVIVTHDERGFEKLDQAKYVLLEGKLKIDN